MEKKRRFWGRALGLTFLLMIVCSVLGIIVFSINNNLNYISEQQRVENKAWIALGQTDNKTVKEIYDIFLTNTTTIEERVTSYQQFASINALPDWEDFLMVYFYHSEQFLSVLQGKTSPQKFVVLEVESPVVLVRFLARGMLIIYFLCAVGVVITAIKTNHLEKMIKQAKSEEERKNTLTGKF
jgi:hypothetical protein